MSPARAGAARRAVLRWAWRLYRRDWRQQLLTLVLLTVAVAGAAWASTISVNAGSKETATLGDAKAMIQLDAEDAAARQADLAAIRARFGPVEAVEHLKSALPGLAHQVDVRAQDPKGRYGHSSLARREGRYPRNDAEVALTHAVADQLSLRVGDRVTIARVPRILVGIVENPRNLDDEFALVAPASALPGSTTTVLLGTDRPSVTAGDATDTGRSFGVISFGDDHASTIGVVIVAIAVSMALAGLIAASGFLVVAQRRQRQLGLLAALGATERHLRFVLVAAGAFLGATAAVLGLIAGLAVWLVTAPWAERASAHRIDRFDLPWGLLALCATFAVLAAMAAAWWPARTMSKVPVMTALSQRPAAPRPVHRSALLAAVVLLAGVVAIGLAKPRSEHVRPLLLSAGVLAVIAGTVLVAPTVIRMLAAPARRLPLAPRLALRDLARYQARAAAALGAITLALAIALSTVVLAQAGQQGQGPGNLSSRELLISAGATDGPFATGVDPSDLARLDRAVASLARSAGASTVLALDFAMPAATGGSRVEPVGVATPIPHGFRGGGPAFVATPELLAYYGIDPSTVDPATDLLTPDHGVVLLDTSTKPDPGSRSPSASSAIQHVTLSPYSSGPAGLVTEAAMQRHGWTARRAAWLVESRHALTHDQVAAARRAAAAVGLAVEARDTSDPAAAIGRVATIAGSLLALVILAVTIGLIRGESASDIRTLTAVGAPSRSRRAVTAASAAFLALAGVVLAAVGAYLAIGAAYRSHLGQLWSPPVADLVLLVVGLPVLAAAVGWLLAGREPAHLARQPG